jgi:hypothetical protein
MVDRILYVLRRGNPWRDLYEEFGPRQSVYHYFNPGRMLAQTGLDAGDALPLVGVTVVAGVLAHIVIGRGDVA